MNLIVARVNHLQAQGVSPDLQVQDCPYWHHRFDDDTAVFLAGNQRLVASSPHQRRGYRAGLPGLDVKTLGRNHFHYEVAPGIPGLKGVAQKDQDEGGMDNYGKYKEKDGMKRMPRYSFVFQGDQITGKIML